MDGESDDMEFHTALAGARRNNQGSWTLLYRQFAPTILGYLRSQRVPSAEDLLGEVWLQVVRDLPRFSGGPAQFAGWLLRIAHNRLVDSRRADSRRPDLADIETPDVADENADVEGALLRSDELAGLEKLLAPLPEVQRSVIYLRFVLDLRQQDVAQVLGISTPAVKMLQMRASRTLGRQLGREGGT